MGLAVTVDYWALGIVCFEMFTGCVFVTVTRQLLTCLIEIETNETSPLAIIYPESADIDMPLGINRFTVRHRLPPFYQANAPRETLERIIENKARKNCA